jgi:hypothetical protein
MKICRTCWVTIEDKKTYCKDCLPEALKLGFAIGFAVSTPVLVPAMAVIWMLIT